MKRTFFDKVIIVIVVLLIAIFIALASYTTYATSSALVNEKQGNLINEANLFTVEAIDLYLHGNMTQEELQKNCDEYEDVLQTNIWFYDENGNLIAASHREDYSKLPNTLKKLDKTIDINEGFTRTWSFEDIFEDTMISIGLPVVENKTVRGYLILHSTMSSIESIQKDMYNIMIMPFFVMILVVGIVLAYLSGTVLRPIAKLNNAAREYAKGNFDVRTGVSRDDEIGELSDSLEYMAGELSKLDEYRKNFIANISHDFRSPLTSIKGYLEAMLDGTIPVEKYDKYLSVVLNESKRLTKLTTGLLELNNFDTYGPVLKKQEFDIVDLIRETRNTMEGKCEEKSIDFRLNCPIQNTKVYADKTKIGQVIYNLVDNAIKFSSQNGNIVATVYERNDKVFVSIKDEGPGIGKDSQKKVFERFYKIDSSRGKDKAGTGLGLSIVKEIIKAHGEEITLTSTEGVGSEFVFSLSHKKDKE